MTKILITGGTGSWGQEFLKQLTSPFDTIVVVARNEANLVQASRDWPDVKFEIGDIRDYNRIYEILDENSINTVIHLAAVKHVPICEAHPEEAINTNILGSMNLVKACKKLKIKDVVLVSTDKAVEPVNTYGISKAMAEKLFLDANYKVVRAGNVIGTSGSVIPLFRSQIDNNEPVTLTHLDMTRFLMTKHQAIKLVIDAWDICKPGNIVIVRMSAFKLTDVIKVISGQNNYPTKITGIRPGEKLHEVLNSEVEVLNSYHCGNLIVITNCAEINSKFLKCEKQFSSKYVEKDLTKLKELLKDWL